MDTGYVQLLDDDTRARVLDVAATRPMRARPASWPARSSPTSPGAPFDLDAYLARDGADQRARAARRWCSRRTGSTRSADAEWVAAHDALGARFDRFIGFELGPMFVPYGRIYSLAAYEGLLGVASCIGAKHSSLSRAARVGPARGARPGASRLPRVHRQRPRHRHGVLRLRLPARAVGVRARGVRRARPALGGRRRGRSTSSTTCCSTSALSRSARRSPRTATTRRCSCQLRGRIDVRRDTARRAAPSRERPRVLADIAERLEAML